MSVPAALRSLNQWVVWKAETRAGEAKPTKVPYTPGVDRRASSTNPGTWRSHEQAVAALEADRSLAGLGFMFSEADPFTGIDFDDCVVHRDDGTADIHSSVWEILRTLGGHYLEISPSGTGVHAIVRGHWGGGNKTNTTPWEGQLEVYDRERYFTLGHWPLLDVLDRFDGDGVLRGDDHEPADSQGALEELRPMFRKAEHDSTPLTDLPGNPERIERLFLRSGLFTDKWAAGKWDRLRTAELRFALAGQTEFYPRADEFDDDDLLDQIRMSETGAEFEQLWRGYPLNGQGPSEAVASLLRRLAFWCGAGAAPAEAGEENGDKPKRSRLRAYSDVKPQHTEWVWTGPDAAGEGRIPLGGATQIFGTEGGGKTALMLTLIAGWTNGTLPGVFEGTPINVALFAPEDVTTSTLRPRSMAAQADARRLFELSSRADADDTGWSLPDDTAEILADIKQAGVKVVLADPAASLLDPGVNQWSDAAVRHALTPFIEGCGELGISIVLIRHTNKNDSDDPRQRAIGTVGWRQMVRSSLLVGPDPDMDGKAHRALGHDKCNVGPEQASMGFELVPTAVTFDGRTKRYVNAVLGETLDDIAPGDILAAEKVAGGALSKVDIAELLLRCLLHGGHEVLADEVDQYREQAGVSKRTLGTARHNLGVTSHKRPGDGRFVLTLAPEIS